MLTIVGIILTLVGFGGFLALFTGLAGAMAPTLNKMPLGLIGWVIVGVVGLLLILLNRRPHD